MKIIFLDIDGVLNNQIMYEDREDIIGSKGGELSKKCIDQLNDLTRLTEAKIVLSSTWRMDEDVEEYLAASGIKGEIIGKTPCLRDRFSLRGNEIHAWIVENEAVIGSYYSDFHSFVILDDDSDMLLWHRENFFWCDPYAGLTPNLAYKAARFLNR